MADTSSPLVAYCIDIQKAFDRFVLDLQEDFGVSEETIRTILANKDFKTLAATLPGTKPVKKGKKAAVSEPAVSTASPEAEAEEGCIALLKSGERKNQNCGKKISEKSSTGKYCGMHAKLETATAVKAKQAESELNGEVLYLNKWKNFEFGETGLIVKSSTEKVFIGKQLTDGNIVDLGPDDITICKRRQFRYIENYSKASSMGKSDSNNVADTNSTVQFTAAIPLI
jgi:hypothetical protein